MAKQSFYITRAGRFKRMHNTVRFEHEEGHIYLPVEQIEAIYVFSSIELNTKMIEFFGYNQIPVHFFNYYGSYTGSFMPKQTKVSGRVMIRQAIASDDLAERIPIAREILQGAASNITKNIRTYKNTNEATQVLAAGIKEEIKKLNHASDIDELMGIEGNIRKKYYRLIDQVMVGKHPEYVMDGRVKRPPNNKMNSLVSFINSLVYATTINEIYQTHLHPAISFLHQPTERRFSLALDLSEVFKPLLSDRLIFRLINLKMLSDRSFHQTEGICYLNDIGRKKVLEEYNNKLTTTVHHRSLGRNVSYKKLIPLECYKLIKHLLGEKIYKSFKIWW